MSKTSNKLAIGLACCVLLSATAAYAQEPPLPLVYLTGPIELNGLSDEPAWQAVLPLPMTMYEPMFKGTLTERTEIRVAYDDHYLYASGRFYDSDPLGVRANSLYRDRWSGGDFFGLLLDTFNDNENALYFWTNPAGIRGDIAHSNDGASSNSSWNTFWEVATIQNEEGWFAEMRIPFSSLGFQDDRGRVVMGLIAHRYIARKNEEQIFPAMFPDRGTLTPSRARDVLIEGVYSQKQVYITPYALGGLGQKAQLNTNSTAYHLNDELTRDIGLDVKYNLTSNLTLDATINTDFAQVEADDQQVNLSRFSLFFPEKRQFFQERASIFSFNTLHSVPDRLFHSRQIGLQNGHVIPILGGVRLVGRLGSWDVGLIEIQTARSQGFPSENFGVLRLRRQVLNPYSTAGGLVTSRIDEEGRYNVAYGLDSFIRLFGNDYVSLTWAQTFDESRIDENGFDFLNAGLFQALWTRRRRVGLNYLITARRAGKDYLPGLGFTTRQDFTELGWDAGYTWLMDERTAFRLLSPIRFSGFVALRNADQTVESALFEYRTFFQWKTGASLWADFEVHYEDLSEPLFFPDNSQVPMGSSTFFRHEGGFSTPDGWLYHVKVDWGLAQFFDGWRIDIGFEPTWRASRFFELSGAYALNVVRFPERDQGFDAHLVRLRVRGALNTKVSASTFLQYSSAADVLSMNVRFRYNIREGNDLWIVYNQGLNTDRRRNDPVLLLTNDRTLLVKYTHTFLL